MKKPLDILTKAKLIYSGELLAFSVLFAVLGILILTGVIGVSDTKILILTILTLIGGPIMIFNFVHYCVSEKKRKKSSLLDILFLLPVPLVMIPIDIMRFCGMVPNEAYPLIVGITFLYITLAYTTEAIYHWFVPLPLLVEAAEEDEEAEKTKENAIEAEVTEKEVTEESKEE